MTDYAEFDKTLSRVFRAVTECEHETGDEASLAAHRAELDAFERKLNDSDLGELTGADEARLDAIDAELQALIPEVEADYRCELASRDGERSAYYANAL